MLKCYFNFWNYAANLQEDTHGEVRFQSHFGMGFLLWICCIFSGLLLKPGPRPWTRTLKNMEPKKPGLRKTWTLENLDAEKPGPWKTCTQKNLDPEKSGLWKAWTVKNAGNTRIQKRKKVRRPHGIIY